MRRNQMLVNILTQLIHNPDETTATHIKNFVGWPTGDDAWNKQKCVTALREALSDASEMEMPE